MSSDSLVALVARSLRALREEVPVAHRALCAAAPGRCVRIEMDGEVVAVAVDPAGVDVVPPSRPADVHVHTSRRATLALADGATTLLGAAEAGAVEIVGTPDDVVAFHDALHCYFHGAVRAPSFPALLAAFRRRAWSEGGPP